MERKAPMYINIGAFHVEITFYCTKNLPMFELCRDKKQKVCHAETGFSIFALLRSPVQNEKVKIKDKDAMNRVSTFLYYF